MARIPVVILQSPVGTSNPAAPSAALNTGAGARVQLGKGPALSRERFANRQLNRIQAAANQAFRQAAAQDDSTANVIRGWSFTANVTQPIPHGLTDSRGRPIAWTSYRIENVQTTFARFFAAHVVASDASVILVTADADCIADVRVW